MLGWIDTLSQGILLGGLYSLDATGLSVIFGIMRLVKPGAWRFDRAWRIFDPRGYKRGRPACGPCVVVVPLMFVVGYALQSVLLNRALGRNILPPLLITFGLSIIVQNGLLNLFPRIRAASMSAPVQSASLPLGGGIAIGVLPLICLLSAITVILLLNGVFYPDGGRQGVSRHLR